MLDNQQINDENLDYKERILWEIYQKTFNDYVTIDCDVDCVENLIEN